MPPIWAVLIRLARPREDTASAGGRQGRAVGVRTVSGRWYGVWMSDAVEAPRRYRLEVRVNPEQDALIREAADLEATTVSAFVLETVTARAKKVIREHQDLVLSAEAYDRFIAELDKPAESVPELVELFRRSPKLPEG